jgi:RNA polymerase sigma-70 factor (ECF subfamily)
MVVLGILNHPEDAQDVAQEAFFKAYTKIRGFRGQSGFYTWIYKIAVNLSLDFLRRRKRDPLENVDGAEAAEESADRPSGEPYRDLCNRSLREEIFQAIDELTPEHKAVMILRVLEGLSYKEIGRVLNCPEGTVMSRLHYARKQLQEKLGPWL